MPQLAVALEVRRALGHLAELARGGQLREVVGEPAGRIVRMAQLEELRLRDRELQLLPARKAEEAGMETRDLVVGERVLAAAVRASNHHGCSYGISLAQMSEISITCLWSSGAPWHSRGRSSSASPSPRSGGGR